MEVLSAGEKVHIIERRVFAGQPRRHFIGEIKVATPHAIRISGYAWLYDIKSGTYVRRPGLRLRVIYLGAGMIINLIPQEVDIDSIRYTKDESGIARITDGKEYGLDLNELITD
ncbi:hypothetical protein AMJ57_00225 [Parcubacteria bacterium SG8_24]|nr:MAG: hypothetical protein AMJ57_00225 [Parcubacteria bacterium SG8_24]